MDLKIIENHFLGGLLGSALGDAIGKVAYRSRTSTQLSETIEKKELLIYTDDTAMALALAEHIISNNGEIDPEMLGKLFHKHYEREPRRGYGPGPPTIFQKVAQSGGSYVDAAKSLYNGQGSFGNGASMRITPLGLFFFDSSDETIRENATKSSIPTHTHPLGIEGACILAKAFSLALKETQISNLDKKLVFIDELIAFTTNPTYEEQLHLSKKLLLEQTPLKDAEKALGSNVTAIKSVPFAIHAFLHNPNNYEESLLETILVSRDKDTVGAITGGLLGAHLGINAIPNEWLNKLENRENMERLAEGLANLKYKLSKQKP